MVSIDLNPNEFTCFKTNYAKDSRSFANADLRKLLLNVRLDRS